MSFVSAAASTGYALGSTLASTAASAVSTAATLAVSIPLTIASAALGTAVQIPYSLASTALSIPVSTARFAASTVYENPYSSALAAGLSLYAYKRLTAETPMSEADVEYYQWQKERLESRRPPSVADHLLATKIGELLDAHHAGKSTIGLKRNVQEIRDPRATEMSQGPKGIARRLFRSKRLDGW